MKKDRRKVASAELEMDPEAAKQNAIKHEQKRAEVISLFIRCSFSCPLLGEFNYFPPKKKKKRENRCNPQKEIHGST